MENLSEKEQIKTAVKLVKARFDPMKEWVNEIEVNERTAVVVSRFCDLAEFVYKAYRKVTEVKKDEK